MPIYPLVVEEARRRFYEQVSDQTEGNGINLRKFYDNRSYFRKADNNRAVAFRGSHPTLVHWPLGNYSGGDDFCDHLAKLQAKLGSLIKPESIQWVKPYYWHSTAFSPVHSTDPDVIKEKLGNPVPYFLAEVPQTKPYILSFTRIVVTEEGGVLATAYAHNDELTSLRTRLLNLIPNGHISSLIHITMGHLVKGISDRNMAELNQFTRAFRDDQTIIGQLFINFLTCARYKGPFLEMTIERIDELAGNGKLEFESQHVAHP